MNAANICNKALAEIGRDLQIGDFYDGSPAASVALNLYSQARDDLLRLKDWPFAGRTALLTLLKQAQIPPLNPWDETQPVPPWQYEYAYPSDCIYLRYLRPQPNAFGGWDDFEPVPILFRIANDLVSSVQTKVILTNMPVAMAIYTAQVTDPDLWEPGFVQSLVETLAQKFAVKFTETAAPPPLLDTLLKGKLGEAGAEEKMADDRRG